MLKAARIFDLFILVVVGAGAISQAFKSSSLPELIGATAGAALLVSPLWLALLALGPIRPRIEKAALLANKTYIFLLACSIVAIIFSLIGNPLGFSFLPLVVLLFIASALNISAINKQRKQRLAAAPNTAVERDAPQAAHPSP